MANSSSWTLRETLIVAMLGTVFAVLYLGWVQVWLVAQAAFGSLTMDVVMGFWFIASIVAAAIVRKPGVALASEVLAAAVLDPAGQSRGPALARHRPRSGRRRKFVFAATRWRRYDLPVLMAAGIGAAVFSFAVYLDSLRLRRAAADGARRDVRPALCQRRSPRRLARLDRGRGPLPDGRAVRARHRS